MAYPPPAFSRDYPPNGSAASDLGWNLLNLDDSPTEQDPNNVGSISSDGKKFTININDGVGQTEMGQGVYRQFTPSMLKDANGNTVWSDHSEFPGVLELMVEVDNTYAEPVGIFLGFNTSNAVIGGGFTSRAIAIDMQSGPGTPRGAIYIGNQEVYYTANANTRSMYGLFHAPQRDETAVGGQTNLTHRAADDCFYNVYLANGSVLYAAWYHALVTTAFPAYAASPYVFFGANAFGAMGGPLAIGCWAAYRWRTLPRTGTVIKRPSEV